MTMGRGSLGAVVTFRSEYIYVYNYHILVFIVNFPDCQKDVVEVVRPGDPLVSPDLEVLSILSPSPHSVTHHSCFVSVL